jgi:carbonic anhydrase
MPEQDTPTLLGRTNNGLTAAKTLQTAALVMLAMVLTTHESQAKSPGTEHVKPESMQSPIDLPPNISAEDAQHRIEIHYGETSEHLIHRQHTIEVEYDPGSIVAFDGKKYELAQVHFHTPSEHLVAHERYPVELHLVHSDTEGQLLVLGVLFEIGAPNPFIERILSDAPRDVGRIDLARHLDVSQLFPKEKHFYTYRGSLTTPPYTEGVRWLILSEHPSVSPEQVVRLLVLEGGNARDVQPLNGRPIDGL